MDCNNQYGFELGASDTESPELWANFVTTQKDELQDGFLFEVELEYPIYFPLAPVHQEIKRDFLSPYQKNLADDFKVKVGGEKLFLHCKIKRSIFVITEI